MPSLFIFLGVFGFLHYFLHLPLQLGIIAAFISVAGLWVLWKLRYIILGIVGLEFLLGNDE